MSRLSRYYTNSLLAASLLAVAGCGTSADPTAPREVKRKPPVERPPGVSAAVDEEAPSRGLPCTGQPSGPTTIGLCGAATDNYKASFNKDPEAPELRSWLALHTVRIDGTHWEPKPGSELTSNPVRLIRADGKKGEASMRIRIVSGPGSTATVRVGPQKGFWGPLLTLEDRSRLRTEPVRVRIEAQAQGADNITYAVDVLYRFDKDLAGAPKKSLEHNGPGGRWVVNGESTATNLELGWE